MRSEGSAMATPSSRSSSRASRPAAMAISSSSSAGPAQSSHHAMLELKQKILAGLAKLSDRDTCQIGIEDLERLIRTLPPEGAPTLLSCLLHDPPSLEPSSRHSPITARRECLRLLAFFCSAHPEIAAVHLPKIVSHIVRRIKDPSSDSSVRDACRDSIGALSSLYIASGGGLGGENGGSAVSLFVKPLLEVLGEQNKNAQAAASACLARVIDCAQGSATAVVAFQKLCPRISKLLGGQSFLAKGALLSVASSLSQIGAITPQTLPALLQSVRECLENSDWATRKSAGDTLCVLASHSSHLIGDNTDAIVAALDSSRFDKVKPVRDSIGEALIQWKKLTGSGEDVEENKDRRSSSSNDIGEKLGLLKLNPGTDQSDASLRKFGASPAPSNENISDTKGSAIPAKAAVLLKKKAPSLTDKELNAEFFQKLETRISDDLPVEVVLPRRGLESALSLSSRGRELSDERLETIDRKEKPCSGPIERMNSGDVSLNSIFKQKVLTPRRGESQDQAQDNLTESRPYNYRDARVRSSDVDDKEVNSPRNPIISRVDGHSESFANSKGNWLAIQRQLSLLERQQASLMNMLQDFMGGSHDSMVTLENRVRGLERIVDEMARDLSLSSSRRGNTMLGGFTDRFRDHSNGRYAFTERFFSSDPYTCAGPRRGLESLPSESRPSRTDNNKDQISSRRAWEKGPGSGPFRLGEGPSARSVWQASKDEATLEAIRVAGPVPELNGDFVGNSGSAGDRGELWASWNRALDSVHVGDVDSAYAEVLSTGDQLLLVKLMDRSGPALDQLGDETAAHVLCAISQFLLEQGLLDIALSWVNQLVDLVGEEGGCPPGVLKGETKREILMALHAASSMELPEEWEGPSPEQMVRRLASAWGINLQQLLNQEMLITRHH
ncbi:microtubule-associated protein TORTIFOLIA1-like isoform X2 [Wolffia australiana]